MQYHRFAIQMANSSAPPELEKQNGTQDMLELTNDLERMIEDVENLSVQLTWMTYDVVRLRISPELVESMQKLKDACDRCKVAVYRDQDQEQDKCTEPHT
ncbi:synaptonemal complex central element protein 3 [Sphaeramia orbicularis]|uniref:synaptonemal complex central element protein 3 n=1 Tax=Sphaeramia orbicularis TaxID=375764 RepID=UPI00117FCA83|nr:synaptonemal complex central element protein 3 [Sphaeramia orbicularis]